VIIEGTRKEFYYEAERGGNKSGVTVSPFYVDGKYIGFIQSFSIIHQGGKK
jgi:hypothetical protein